MKEDSLTIKKYIESFYSPKIDLANINYSSDTFFYFILLSIILVGVAIIGNFKKSKSFSDYSYNVSKSIILPFSILIWLVFKLILFMFLFTLIIVSGAYILDSPDNLKFLLKVNWKEFLIRSFGIICIVYSSHIIFVEYNQNIEKKWIRTRFLLSLFLGIYSILIY